MLIGQTTTSLVASDRREEYEARQKRAKLLDGISFGAFLGGSAIALVGGSALGHGNRGITPWALTIGGFAAAIAGVALADYNEKNW